MSNDTWMVEFIQRRTEAAFNDAKTPPEPIERDEDDPSGNTLLAKLMIICALNVCGSMAVELVEKEKAIQAAAEKEKTMLRLHQAQIAQRSQPVVSNDRPVSGPEAGDGSDYELAPEEAPRVLPQATVNKLETAEIPPVSPESDTWIITSPLTGGHQDASIERTRRKDDPVPGPESEKAAEPEPPVQPLDE